jgi:hypothetical protein
LRAKGAVLIAGGAAQGRDSGAHAFQLPDELLFRNFQITNDVCQHAIPSIVVE